ncbi:MAG: agmatine deiminase family protein [Bacteroidetes bacterium]|nr:MAG: agmatine deiminase family protein [Bacteroidota bacterium]
MEFPQSLGYSFPAEWERHEATWLTFPLNRDTWEGEKWNRMLPAYFQFIRLLAEGEVVNIILPDSETAQWIHTELEGYGTNLKRVRYHYAPTNDSWTRDHGPAFVINKAQRKKAIVNWEYNAWGGKYPPFDSDNRLPKFIAQQLGLRTFDAGIVMEGGSVEFNGQGTVLTTRHCLLNKNRNPHLSQGEIEDYLCRFYGVSQVLWLDEGIVGDDTDGHIDDITRFINQDTVVTVVEDNKLDDNYWILQKNLSDLKLMRLANGQPLNIVELPMPSPVETDGIRLPASYANFYIANDRVIVPTFSCKQDDKALRILENCFPKRQVIGVNARYVIWGLGSFHCMSQQEPAL